MTKIFEPILFFGSGPVAAESLKLIQRDFKIEAVITRPQPETMRQVTPVISVANTFSIPFFTSSTKTELDQLMIEKNFRSKIAILIDFGIILSQSVIDYFPLGIVNSHFSLLPRWRGPDPITWAILSGEKNTGVSLMLVSIGIDEGPILAQKTLKISKDDTNSSLTSNLTTASHNLLVETLPKYISGDIKPHPQSVKIEPSYSRKLTKEDGIVNWDKPAQQIEREIRAFSSWPKSHTEILGHSVIVTKAKIRDDKLRPGQIKITDSKNILVGTAKDSLEIERLKPLGRSEMTAASFLAGYNNT